MFLLSAAFKVFVDSLEVHKNPPTHFGFKRPEQTETF